VATYLYHEIHRNNNAALSLGGHELTDPHPPPPWVLCLQTYINAKSGTTPFYLEPVGTVIVAKAYLEQRRIAHQLDLDNGVEPEIEDITAAAEAVTDLTIDTDEECDSKPRNGPQKSFVVIAEPATADIQACGTEARTQIEQYLHTVETCISAQPVLCAYTTNIRQHPEDPNNQDFQDGQPRRVRRRTDEDATAAPFAVAHEVDETHDATDWLQYLPTVGQTISAVEQGNLRMVKNYSYRGM
jgi:hypothetical protein